MDTWSLLIFLAIGAIAGWLAGLFMKGKGFGLIGNIIVGIIGAIVGVYVLRFFGIAFGGLIGAMLTATLGAVVLLAIIGIIKKA